MKNQKLSLDLETQQANLLKLLAHPVRIAILKILRQEEACVCHMETILGYRQAYLSQQLAILRQSNIIVDRRDGWNIYYQIQDKSILQLLDLSEKFVGPEKTNISSNPVKCPCPKCALKTTEEPCCEEKEKESLYVNN